MAATVARIMTPGPVMVDADTVVIECARLMEINAIGALGVTRDGRLIGVLTDRDIVLRALAHGRDPSTTAAGEIASANPVTVPGEASVEDAEQKMRTYAVRRLFVVDGDDRPVGILSVDDLTALRYPQSVAAAQIREWNVMLSDQGYSD